MAILKCHKLVSTSLFATVAVVTASLLMPEPADAASGLFRMKRTWWGGTPISTTYGAPGVPDPYISTDYHPHLKGPNKAPAAKAYVGTTVPPRFTAPSKFIVDYTYYGACVPGTCFPGYPESKAWYSYWNIKGSFRPGNSAFGGAATTTTVRFPTTNPQTVPLNQGNPITPTTTPCVGGGLTGCGYLAHDLPFGGTPMGTGTRLAGEKISFVGGNYDFSRAGSVMIVPGPNRFGGTMHFFYGPNHDYYQRLTINSPYISKAYGPQMDVRTPYADTALGDVQYGGPFNIYRMTAAGYNRATTGGQFIKTLAPYFYTINPFTTGMVTGWQPFGATNTRVTVTGYDNRTPAGLNGVISLVRPRLVHTYKIPFDPNDPIRMTWASASAWQMNFLFLPEPGSAVMLASGLVAMAGLYRLRRR